MKTNLYLIFSLIAAMTLSSCEESGHLSEIKDKDNYKYPYDEAFVREFGQFSKADTWNSARAYTLDITPGADGIVKIYARCRDSYRLVAHYRKAYSRFEASFDAPDTSTDFIVAMGGKLFQAAPGDHVSPSSRPATDVKVDDTPLRWILAVENDFNAVEKRRRTGDELDFDFNDIVLGISSVVTDDGVSLDLTPLACGDDQPLYIHMRTDNDDWLLWPSGNGNVNDCEFHQWFGVRETDIGINTAAYRGSQVKPDGAIKSVEALTSDIGACHVDMPVGWSLANYSYVQYDYSGNLSFATGLYITVGTFKSLGEVLKNKDYGVICCQGRGYAPRMLLFLDSGSNGNWRWTTEGNSLASGYPVFLDRVADPDHKQFMLWHEFEPNEKYVRDIY